MRFRPLAAADFALLHEWLARPHVSRWWPTPTLAALVESYRPTLEPASTTRAFIAELDGVPIGFIQSCVLLGADDGWWEDETDPGARGIDQFLADEASLGRGLGSRMVRAFVDALFRDPAVTRVQADPSPDNARAIGCYRRAGFAARGEIDTTDGRALLMVRERA